MPSKSEKIKRATVNGHDFSLIYDIFATCIPLMDCGFFHIVGYNTVLMDRDLFQNYFGFSGPEDCFYLSKQCRL